MTKKSIHILQLMLIVFFIMFCQSCKKQSNVVTIEHKNMVECFDFHDIETTGELIVATMTGPESYYVYHGKQMGLQYFLADDFSRQFGFKLRIEVAQNEKELIKMLLDNKVDIIAYELSDTFIKKYDIIACGVNTDSLHTSWAVRKNSKELAKELNKWYKPKLKKKVFNNYKKMTSDFFIKRKVYSPYYSKANGIISKYDHLFMKYCHIIGWDWKLLAALCYQESAFDTYATSWAGAKGLMQIMPTTANIYGVSRKELVNPEINIKTSALYLKKLNSHFSNIRNNQERIKFILASYNGGVNHIKDAMNLAKKYKKNPYVWNNVSYYVLHLSESKFYKDPVVKNGYMIGSETYNYVNSVMHRWYEYRGRKILPYPSFSIYYLEPKQSEKKNRFSQNNQIYKRNDSIFQK